MELAQSKLRLMKYKHENPTPEMRDILRDMCVVVALLLKAYVKEKKDIDCFAEIEAKFSKLSTNESPNNPIDDADALLASVEKLQL